MKYLVIEYGPNVDRMASETYHFVEQADLWEWLDRAKSGGIKIAVYQIGKCVIDWS